ncbi:MAG: HIT domain-containing protein [Nitrososphaerota archaeon]|nr:HIT domain-containing protein [Nitrososphaerota archaeon]MDG7023731.1 HIT domain-containing protein [Nitrososphaerota archaeon]
MPCVFCDIAAGKSPASVIYEDSDVMALLDINPVQRGHSLIIPKRHYVDIWDVDPEVAHKIVLVTGRVARRMKEVWGTEGVNTFSANGKPADQDIYHFHMHIIPLGKGERTKFADWWLSAMGKAERQDLDKLAAELRFE